MENEIFEEDTTKAQFEHLPMQIHMSNFLPNVSNESLCSLIYGDIEFISDIKGLQNILLDRTKFFFIYEWDMYLTKIPVN